MTNAFIGTVSPLSDASSNLGIQRGLRGQEAGYQDQARREYAQDVENLRNAVWSNINKGVNTAGQAAMMMV
mgnify:CR=1 FL=1